MSEIDFINQPLNLEQEFDSRYIKLTDYFFNEYTGYYHVEGEILDKSHNAVGSSTINGYIYHFYQDDQNMNLKFSMEVDLKGDIEKIGSPHKSI